MNILQKHWQTNDKHLNRWIINPLAKACYRLLRTRYTKKEIEAMTEEELNFVIENFE